MKGHHNWHKLNCDLHCRPRMLMNTCQSSRLQVVQ